MKLAHLSDLHFGNHICIERLKCLTQDLISQNPDLLVVTGDLTDRGRISQFKQSVEFLKSFSIPFVVVPGNREICISAVWEWALPRLAMRRYRSFFGKSDRIIYQSDSTKVVVIGLNSVHPFPSWPGRISKETRYWLKNIASEYSGYKKILCLHHPVLPVIRASSFWAHTLSDAGEILNICTQTGIFLILQGHKHRSAVMQLSIPQRNTSVIVSSSGAPLRSRWDSVYHMIEIFDSKVLIQCREFVRDKFVERGLYEFETNMNSHK